MKKGKDLKVGDLVPIYYNPPRQSFIDKMGVITDIVGYKSIVLIDGALETWPISDLKKMESHKNLKELYNENR